MFLIINMFWCDEVKYVYESGMIVYVDRKFDVCFFRLIMLIL